MIPLRKLKLPRIVFYKSKNKCQISQKHDEIDLQGISRALENTTGTPSSLYFIYTHLFWPRLYLSFFVPLNKWI